MIQREEFYYDSRDNEHKIRALKWVPEGEIVCILQLIHGMAEHVERYDDFARFMAEKGVLVVANDHLGHGKSINSRDELGYFCAKDPLRVVVRDIHRLKKLTQEAYPGKKYFILGHSMGSMLLRNYIFRYGKGFDGAILSGTASMPYITTKPGLAIMNILAAFKGWKCISPFAANICNGGYNKRIANPKTEFDWLSVEEENVKRYIADDLCGYLFTLNGYHTLIKSVDNLNKKKYLANMPQNLPVIFLSGEEDPVGNYGAGVKRAYKQFINAGMKNTSIKLYPNMRHEILNETDKQLVYDDVYNFIMQNMNS